MSNTVSIDDKIINNEWCKFHSDIRVFKHRFIQEKIIDGVNYGDIVVTKYVIFWAVVRKCTSNKLVNIDKLRSELNDIIEGKDKKTILISMNDPSLKA